MLARYFSLAVFLLLVVAASAIAAVFEAGEWYHFIMSHPSWTPPEWVFILGWAVVNVLLALAAWKIWSTGHFSRMSSLAWWALLPVLNIAWPALFFGLNRPGWSMPVLALALGVAVFCIRSFNRLSRDAALLMTPYLAWVVYILFFDFAVWSNNGGFLENILS